MNYYFTKITETEYDSIYEYIQENDYNMLRFNVVFHDEAKGILKFKLGAGINIKIVYNQYTNLYHCIVLNDVGESNEKTVSIFNELLNKSSLFIKSKKEAL